MLSSKDGAKVRRMSYKQHNLNAVVASGQFRLLCEDCQSGVTIPVESDITEQEFEKLIRYAIIEYDLLSVCVKNDTNLI